MTDSLKVYALNDVVPEEVRRLGTGYDELDFIYGNSDHSWGMPCGAISLWAGTGGIGKSRWAVEVAKKQAASGLRILYFQKESSISMFVSSKLAGVKLDNFYLSNESKLDNQLQVIRQVNPDVVYVDSVNAIAEYNGGRGAELIIDGDVDTNRKGYHDVLAEVGAHAVFLAQLNQDGSTKGGTTLTHFVDQVYALNTLNKAGKDIRQETGCDNMFVMHQHIKNRYGKVMYNIALEHNDAGVACISNARWYALKLYNDSSWYDFGKPPTSMDEIPLDLREDTTQEVVSSPIGQLWLPEDVGNNLLKLLGSLLGSPARVWFIGCTIAGLICCKILWDNVFQFMFR